MGFLVGALALFVAFHFLPGPRGVLGWTIWTDVWQILKDPYDLFTSATQMVALASFLNFSLLIIASPFLTPVWQKSRLAWWIALVCSGASAAAFVGLLAMNPPDEPLGIGGWFLFTSPALNFIGLLFARKDLMFLRESPSP